jgi:hypothetical protein
VSVPLAHVAGLPVEEGVRVFFQASAAMAYLIALGLAWLRHR